MDNEIKVEEILEELDNISGLENVKRLSEKGQIF